MARNRKTNEMETKKGGEIKMTDLAVTERLDTIIRQQYRIIQLLEEVDEEDEEGMPTEEELLGEEEETEEEPIPNKEKKQRIKA